MLVELLSPLCLSRIEPGWVRDVWDREFLEYMELPQEYETLLEEVDVSEVLHAFSRGTKKWLDAGQDGEGEDKTWRALVQPLRHRELTALLFCLMQRGQKTVLNEESRICAILAARTYFTMLMIPGSNVYRIFHSQMYVQCLSCFKLFNQLLEQEFFNDTEDLNLLNRQLKSLLSDLHILVYNVNLKGDNDSVEETVCCLVEFIGNNNIDPKLHLDNFVLSRLQALALQCIDLLIQNEDDETPDENIIKLIFKALLPKFTAIGGSKKTVTLWRASGVTYCGALLLKYGEAATCGFICLIQHLCYNSEGMERVDNRSSRVHLVVGLLSLMPLKPYKELLQWIVKLSRNAKPQLRLFAVDVLGSLVSGKDRNFENAIGITSDPQPSTSNDIVIDNPTNLKLDGNMEIEEQHNVQNANQNNDCQPSTSMNVMEGAEKAPEDIEVPTQHQEVAHRDLLKVVYERCDDVSSTVRTKAVSILAAFTSPNNQLLKTAIKDVFHNEEAILELATKKLRDERVTVRRTAMTLLENVFVNSQSLLTKENLEPLVRLCRDTSIMVRCAAISTLTSLATKFNNYIVFDAWLSGPLHQLSDPEVKVQDIVVDQDLRNLLVTPLKPYSVNMTVSDRKPWLLLSAIVRKNMRKHLARAMSKLAKSSNILNYKLVDILYTHIGTENNLLCWVLLSCVARHILVADVHFVLDYYNDLNPEQLFGDIRLVSLVLEVLREWSGCIPEVEAAVLRARLIRELCEGTLPAAGARGAVALCVSLSKRMGDNSDWAANLVQEGELKMIGAWRSRENGLQIQGTAILTVADLALASDRRPSSQFIELLMELSGARGDENVDPSINVSACAVAALGKLSIRERNTASIVAPLCAKLLTTPHCQLPLKVNAMCVLADLCTRFTSIVEPMLPSVCACLGSPELSVRRCATQLVTQLLVQDFLRLRGSLYFHYFPLVCDEDETVKDIANYYILNCLVQRNKNILYHNFVECIFYYNKFEGHAVYGKFHVTDEERRLFTLEGEEKRNIRLTLYDMMLSHMSDLQRLNTQMKLCKELTTVGDMGVAGMDVLRDAVSSLRRAVRCQQIKQQSMADDMAARVTHNIISQKTKLNVVEMVVPTVMKLHRKLRTANDTSNTVDELLGDLVAYACDLLKDYKQEIEELFEADTDLMQEITVLQSSTSTPHPSGQRSRRVPAGLDEDDNAIMDDLEESKALMSTPLTSKQVTVKSAQLNKRQSRKANNLTAKRSLPLTATI